jgi:hypothetical protein
VPSSRLRKSKRIAGLFPNPGNILRPGGYGRVRTAVRVQQDAPLYEQPEFFNSELAAFAAS